MSVRLARSAVALVAAAGLLIGVVGCSSGTGGGAGAAASPVATTSVDLPASYKFAPASIVVHVGDTVTWTNHDNFTHSVQFTSGGLPNTPEVMSPGQSATYTFTTAGTFTYQCHLHPQNMQGTVTVEG